MDKSIRMLTLYERLNRGKIINKANVALEYDVDEKTIQRDIGDLKKYFEKINVGDEIKYSREARGYKLHTIEDRFFKSEEIMVMTKVLLESRAFSKKQIDKLIYKCLKFCMPEKRKHIEEIIKNEKYHYVPAREDENLINKIWQISLSIKEQKIIKINYKKENDDKAIERKLRPQGIVFSEYYFYLVAYIHGKDYKYPTIYRLDRIVNIKTVNEKFRVSNQNRFEEGEFRKRVQFMTTGKLMKVRFRFWGKSVEAVLERLPTARIVTRNEKETVIEAEVFGKGIKMWLLSQGKYIEVLEPKELRDEMIDIIDNMKSNYIY